MFPQISGVQQLPRRATVFTFIVGAHMLLAYAFATGMVRDAIEVLTTPLEATVLEPQHQTQPQPPPPDTPTVTNPVIRIPQPEVFYPSDDSESTVYARHEPEPAPVRYEPPPPEPIALQGNHRLPNTADYYPPAAIRQEIEGIASVRVCVDESGRRTGDPVIEQSSGSALLDKGAIELAKDGRYARSTQGGRPVPNCHRFRIRFDLN